MTITAGEIAQRLDAPLHGDAARPIAGPAILRDASAVQIAFYKDAHKLTALTESAAGTVLITPEIKEKLGDEDLDKSFILVDDPHGSFIGLLPFFFPKADSVVSGIAPSAIVDPTATIGANTNVHPGAVIERGVVIGENCEIGPGAIIRRESRIGNDTILHPNVVLYPQMEIGNRVILHAGVVIGADGFGYRQENGRHVKIPHYGNVVIEDDVEVGANTTIDRSFLGSTRIGAGTKIDNQVQIAHNCELGQHNIIISQVGFAGSVTTGEYVICAGQVGVADHVHLGTGSIVGAKAGVHKDLPGGETYLGAPAIPESEAIRQVMALRKLPELRQLVKQLEKQIRVLQDHHDGPQSSAA